MNNDFISKELALWLKERGCEIEANAYYYRWRAGKNAPLKDCIWGEWDFVLGRNDEAPLIVDDGVNPEEEERCNAYSWYSILVTHAKGFWGDAHGQNEISPCCSHQRLHPIGCCDADENTCLNCRATLEVTFVGNIGYRAHSMRLLHILLGDEIEKAEAYVREHSLFANS